MSTWQVSNEVRNKIASTGPLGQAWLDELARDRSGDVDGHRAMTADVEEVEVVVAHQERITLRVGDVFVKLDADRSRLDVEVEAMTMPPVPTPEILWRKPHELALAALPGTALGRLGQPSPSSPAAWAAAGAAVRASTTMNRTSFATSTVTAVTTASHDRAVGPGDATTRQADPGSHTRRQG